MKIPWPRSGSRGGSRDQRADDPDAGKRAAAGTAPPQSAPGQTAMQQPGHRAGCFQPGQPAHAVRSPTTAYARLPAPVVGYAAAAGPGDQPARSARSSRRRPVIPADKKTPRRSWTPGRLFICGRHEGVEGAPQRAGKHRAPSGFHVPRLRSPDRWRAACARRNGAFVGDADAVMARAADQHRGGDALRHSLALRSGRWSARPPPPSPRSVPPAAAPDAEPENPGCAGNAPRSEVTIWSSNVMVSGSRPAMPQTKSRARPMRTITAGHQPHQPARLAAGGEHQHRRAEGAGGETAGMTTQIAQQDMAAHGMRQRDGPPRRQHRRRRSGPSGLQDRRHIRRNRRYAPLSGASGTSRPEPPWPRQSSAATARPRAAQFVDHLEIFLDEFGLAVEQHADIRARVTAASGAKTAARSFAPAAKSATGSKHSRAGIMAATLKANAGALKRAAEQARLGAARIAMAASRPGPGAMAWAISVFISIWRFWPLSPWAG